MPTISIADEGATPLYHVALDIRSQKIQIYCRSHFYFLYNIIIVAQDQPLNFTVTDLTSSVEASGRKFACENEEVVYRCEATSMIPNASFLTEWKWNGAQVVTFNSRQQVGSSEGPDDVICKSTNTTNQPYLHATLVSAASDTCVSLLIVIPSLSSSSSRYDSAMIQCMTYGVSRSESPDNETINYNPISRESYSLSQH